MAEAKVVQLILTSSVRGRGTEGNIMRSVAELWSMDGALVAELDVAGPDGKSPSSHALGLGSVG